MVIESRGSDVVDPLLGYWGVALFPKTFGVLPEPSKPYDPDDDLQAIHNHLKSMALRSPGKLKEQAKIILNSGSASCQASKDKNETVPAKAEEDPRERRPALGRKRARFSLKPDSSQPAVSLEPTLDIKKLKDPEEFFMAYERHENAKKEIQKQIGGNLSDSEQYNPSPLVSRRRRPGILGRSARYKHLYSSLNSDDNDNVVSSQEAHESSILSPSYRSSQQEADHDFSSNEMELGEHKIDEILDGLLSSNYEDLEGDQALSLLQESLQIKPLDLDKLRLPDFEDIPKISLKSSRENLPKPTCVLSNIDNMLKVTSTKTPVKVRLGRERSVDNLASPTPPKSPFASMSLLNKRIFLSNSSSDPFSHRDIDQLPVTNPSSTEHISKQFGLADVGNQSDKMKSPQNEQDNNTRTLEPIRDFSSHTSGKCVNGDSRKVAAVTDVVSSTSPVSVMEEIVMNDKAAVIVVGSSVSPVSVEDKVADCNIEDIIISDNLGGSVADEDTQANRATINNTVFNLDTLLKGISTKTPMKLGQMTESSVNYLDPPTPPKSPLASLSLLSKQTIPSGPITPCDIDQLPVTNPSPIQLISKQFSTVDVGKQSDKMKSPLHDQDDDNRTPEVAIRDSTHTSDKFVVEDSSAIGAVLDVVSSASRVIVEDKATGSNMENMVINETEADEDDQANRATVEDKVENRVGEAVALALHDIDMMDSTLDNSKSIQSKFGTASLENQTMDGQSRTPNDDVEQQNEEIQEQSRITVDKQSKAKSRPRLEKEISRRKSLAGAGTRWQSGIRRSSRIRTRPLEYWKGERFLYGRIHESLATVIGLKYASPAKEDGKRTLKVKSYVSDEYKELVDHAALH